MTAVYLGLWWLTTFTLVQHQAEREPKRTFRPTRDHSTTLAVSLGLTAVLWAELGLVQALLYGGGVWLGTSMFGLLIGGLLQSWYRVPEAQRRQRLDQVFRPGLARALTSCVLYPWSVLTVNEVKPPAGHVDK